MINVEERLVPLISDRLKALRLTHGKTMDNVSNKSSVSRIEKGKKLGNTNFISNTVLLDYTTTFNLSPKEIIFGQEEDIEELVRDIFYTLFYNIKRQDLVKYSHLYNNVTDTVQTAQKAMISLAEMFAEYNKQRYNFFKTSDSSMDSLCKSLDHYYGHIGKFTNPARDFRQEPVNALTVIDCIDMADKVWMICNQKVLNSYTEIVINHLFRSSEPFIYSSINALTDSWIEQHLCKLIIPEIVSKMKSNTLFNLGLLTKYLLQNFIQEKLPTSFQTTIPIKITRPKEVTLKINNHEQFSDNPLTDTQMKQKYLLLAKAQTMINIGNMPDDAFIAKLALNNITIETKVAEEFTREEPIDSVIDRVISAKFNGPTTQEFATFEESPIFKINGTLTHDELDSAFTTWHEDTHFKNQSIPGYFSNNSQIMYRMQERLNANIFSMVDDIVHIQNNALKLLTEEDLLYFAK